MNAYGTTTAGRYATTAARGATKAKRLSRSSELREGSTKKSTITGLDAAVLL
jgi:hypothetical protein